MRRLGAVELEVPDPAETAAFFRDVLHFGHEISDGGVHHLMTDGPYGARLPSRVLSLARGSRLNLAALSFQVTADAVEEISSRARAGGLQTSDLGPSRNGGAGVALEDPFGVRVECRVPQPGGGVGSLGQSPVRPRDLSHVNVRVPDALEESEFFQTRLGLKLTEQIGERFCFLRIGSLHHDVGLRTDARTGVHHIAFEVEGWHSFLTICDHLAARDHVVEYGPGRHAPGHSLFVYLVEPASGLRLELCTDMAVIDDDDGFEPIRRDVDRLRSVNVWGPAPPTSFLE